MVCSELRWWDTAATAMWPKFVVVTSPLNDDLASRTRCGKPVIVRAFAAEFSIESLDACVLHGCAGFDQQVFDALAYAVARAQADVGAHTYAVQIKQFTGTHAADQKRGWSRGPN